MEPWGTPQERFEKDEVEFWMETVRWDKMKTNQEKYHEDQTNVEDDEEGWNDQQYQRQQINQEE